MCVNMVAPVVVKPDIDSNMASIKDKSRYSEAYKGTAPANPTINQEEQISQTIDAILDVLSTVDQ